MFAFLAKYKQSQWGLKAAFTLIFTFLAIRYDFGNDYQAYLDIFLKTAENNDFNFDELILSYYEPGWMLLNWSFRHFGFFAMIAMLALCNCIIYYRFIAKYVPVKYYWLATFLYIFFPGFMLIHSSAMRQSVATMIFVFSLDYLYRKDAMRYLLCIALASIFHFTALILFSVYLLAFSVNRINFIRGFVLVSVFVALFLFGGLLSPYIKIGISSFSDKYDAYQEPGIVGSGFGFIYYSVLFLITLHFERAQNREISLIYKIAVCSFLIIPLPLIIDMIGRFIIYFIPATIVVYPTIVMNLKNITTKLLFSATLIAITIFQFFQFFSSDIYRGGFEKYHSIFSAPQWF